MEESKKVFVLMPPITGRLNPVSSIVSELVKKNVNVTFYGVDSYRSSIDKSGATYRPYKHYNPDSFKTDSLKKLKNSLFFIVGALQSFASANMSYLIKDIEKERPDIIIMDNFALDARFIYQIMKKKGSFVPRMIRVYTTFADQPGIYPTDQDLAEAPKPTKDIWFYWSYFVLMAKQWWINWKYGSSVRDPVTFMFENEPEILTLTTVCPELQPECERFDKTRFKFVGPCIAENVRKFDITDPVFKQVMDSTEPLNPLKSADQKRSNKHLIYVSLGTVFNDNDFIIDKLIDALQNLNKHQSFNAVISLGSVLYSVYIQRIKTGSLVLPENIILQSSVPQIEVLKRASLFVSHMGMNGFSESKYF